MPRILVFGNPYLEDDALAPKVARALDIRGVEFHLTAEINDLLEEEYDAVLDVAYGIPRVVILEDLERLQEHRLVSLHDYDVAFFLKLLKAMGRLDTTRIIAIPAGYPEKDAIEETRALIEEQVL